MKAECYIFSSYKQRNKVWLVYLKCKLQQDTYGSFILKKMPENGRKYIFSEIQTRNMVLVMFLAFKRLTKNYQLRFWTL